MTGIPHFIAEHQLKTYPYIEPRVQKKRSLSPDRRKVVKEEVEEWLKSRIVKRVQYPTWVANPILVKKANSNWRMCIDFKDLNKACPKDVYPLPEINWKIESLMGFKYKFFLDAYKGYHQIQMPQKDEIGRNLEAYVDDMVIKSKTEQDLIQNVEETLLTLIKGKPKKTKVVMSMASSSNLKQMQSLSGKLATLNRFLSNDAKRVIPCLDTLKKCTNKKNFRWTEAAQEAFQVMNKLIAELATLNALMKDEKLMGGEVNYALMEKLAPELVHATRRLRRYFQGYAIKVVTDKPINQILNSSEASRRLAKWAVELGAYGISYASRNVIKGCARIVKGQGGINKSGPRGRGRCMEAIYRWSLQRSWIWSKTILIDREGIEYSYASRLNLNNSNNDVEYKALLTGLRIEKGMKVKNIHAFVDLKLVASKVEGSYEAHGEKTNKYKEKFLEVDESLCVESSNTRSWIRRIESSGYGVLLFNSSWFLVKCRHKYAVSSLMDTAYR
ncbi:reverse transcriptase domain-containing protein [Tanacetum coccineum]